MQFKRNIKLKVAYDGTRYLGWQKTAMGLSIEEELEKALILIFQQPIQLQAASRTDAFVHATGQIVNFFVEKKEIEFFRLALSLNQILPKDIAVISAEEVACNFHPTLDALSKIYHYHVCTSSFLLPHLRHFVWHYPHALDLEAMKEASRFFLGERDFRALCNTRKNAPYQDFIRKIHRIEFIELGQNLLKIEIKGTRFLYRMARNIVGTLVYVGRGKIRRDEVSTLLESGDRKKAGPTAPALGLNLYQVLYASDEFSR